MRYAKQSWVGSGCVKGNVMNTHADDFAGDNNSLFISYAREDIDWVVFAEKEIARTDYNVWWDRKLKPGQDWWQTICEQIKRCKYFLFVLTSDSLSSIYCTAELQYALALNKPVIPIIPEYGDDVEFLSGRIPSELSKTQYVQVDAPQYFLHILEASLCEIRLKIEVKGEYTLQDLPVPNLPKLSKEKVYEAWVQLIDSLDLGDVSTAVRLCDQIIYSDPGGLGHDAQEMKSRIEEDGRKHILYAKIKAIVEKGKADSARPLWKELKRRFGSYDPDSLAPNFSSMTLDGEVLAELTKPGMDDFSE